MILQELVKYYDRKLKEGEIAIPNFEVKEIPYLIEIKEDGSFVRFISTWTDTKKKSARPINIPKSVKKTRGISANLLWENAEYIFGFNDKKKQESFIEKVKNLYKGLSNPKIKSVLDFYEKFQSFSFEKDALWTEIKEANPNLTFKFESQNEVLFDDKNIIDFLSSGGVQDNSTSKGICLITGEESEIERLHPSIKGVRDAQAVGANIVSFNLSAFESYGKEQGSNAPVSKSASFAYTTALNTLLSRGSHQKIQIGDASTVFWSERKSEIEDIFGGLFETTDEDKKTKEKQDAESAKTHFVSPFTGKYKSLLDDNTRFFVLGLSPNAARISIRFWYPTTVGEISRNIEQHFNDMKLEIPNNETGFIPLYRILKSTAVQGKLDNVNPVLAGKIMMSIISGNQYPRILLSAILIRIKAEQKINFERASMLKAILNRKGRNENFKNYKELQTTMDESNTNIAYRLGRVFAVMEKMQQDAIGGNTTIKDSYYTSASTRPAIVFAKLFALSNHHASKLGSKSIFYEKLKGEILAPLDGNIPRTFSLEQQGLFAIGYYQQRNELFKGKDANQENETTQGDN